MPVKAPEKLLSVADLRAYRLPSHDVDRPDEDPAEWAMPGGAKLIEGDYFMPVPFYNRWVDSKDIALRRRHEDETQRSRGAERVFHLPSSIFHPMSHHDYEAPDENRWRVTLVADLCRDFDLNRAGPCRLAPRHGRHRPGLGGRLPALTRSSTSSRPSIPTGCARRARRRPARRWACARRRSPISSSNRSPTGRNIAAATPAPVRA